MSWRLTLHVYRKEGLEILRDRRTLFVNLILPVLMYPLAALFILQVTQIVHNQAPRNPPVILDVPDELVNLVPIQQDRPLTGFRSATVAASASSPAPTAPPGATVSASATAAEAADIPRMVRLVHPTPALRDELRAAARDLAGIQDPEGDPDHPDHEPKGDQADAARARALTALREAGAVQALVQITAPPNSPTGAPVIVSLRDDAEGQSTIADGVLATAIFAWRRQEVRAHLARIHVPKTILNPFTVANRDLAPRAESLRAHAASFLPMLLVLLATSAAMIPAVDLLAGERERGTLETLLSWPIPRRSLFTGKLLVICTSALVAVTLNLLSLAGTVAVGAGQLAQNHSDFGSIFAVGGSTLLLCFVVLLPITVTSSALALAVTGLASSTKEASNYLSPLLLVMMFATFVLMMPDAHPSLVLDIVPISGSVLALREALEGRTIPWIDLGFSFTASVVLAVVVVGWASRLLDDERFRYPGLVRAGWGRFRVWGPAPGGPGGLEVMAVYAFAVGGFILGAAYFKNLPPALLVILPLVLFVLMPALLDAWAGDHPLSSIRLRLPSARAWPGAFIIALGAVVVSMLIGEVQSQLQGPLPSADHGSETKITELLKAIKDAGGFTMVLGALALAPAICEETLCRGTLLSGLERGVGRGAAVVVSAILFALLHLDPSRFFPQFVLGMVLAVLAQRTGSILPGMLVHFVHNGIVVSVQEINDKRLDGLAQWADNHQTVAGIAMVMFGIGAIAVGLRMAGRRAEIVPAEGSPTALPEATHGTG
jgi:sodium transport system permease protein